MKTVASQKHMSVEITSADLVNYLKKNGYKNAPKGTHFEVTGTNHNYDEVTVGVGLGDHPDHCRPIIATWVEDV